MTAITAALSGLSNAYARFDRAASSLANFPQSPSPETDMVDLIQAKTQARANLAVMQTADEMLGTLLDIRV